MQIMSFDYQIVTFLNKFSQSSKGFDYIMCLLMGTDLIKGGFIMAILWWFWFRNDKNTNLIRERIILTVLSSIIGVFLARLLAFIFPFSIRPVHNAILKFRLPCGMDPSTLISWSSFPSDHAVLFFGLVTGILFISKNVGIPLIFYVLVIICFPRVYLGIHYPSDIIVGALIGIVTSIIIIKNQMSIRYIAKPAMRCADKSPSVFYMCFFLVSYQIAVLFNDLREIGSLMFNATRHILFQ
jgi:undecaprenyl-diphosphatase